MEHCRLTSGRPLHSQDVDDHLFEVPGLLDYRLTLDYSGTEGAELLEMGFQALSGDLRIAEALAAIHTQKRTIVDQR